MGRPAESPFIRAVKRAFADALVAEIRRTRFGRDKMAKSSRMSRAHLQYLLAAERHATLGTFISLAEGLGIRPEELMTRTLEHLDRLRPPPEPSDSSSESPLT